MMNTPICDFVRAYSEKQGIRLHMPGHKGIGPLGTEYLDITEITGADSLYEAEGIIRQSEDNAGRLFGAKTFYSTEGSSLAIRAMLYLTLLFAKQSNRKPLIFAGRNAHKTLVNTAALLDIPVTWLWAEGNESYLSCRITPEALEQAIEQAEEKPVAVYITSPDYLGNMTDIAGVAEVCRHNDCLLLVDNAHGAYLKFLPESLHPMDLGADMCCDSAHKTLPVITGGAYLHIAKDAPKFLSENAKNALSVFGSTSPSYLILQSLDAANAAVCSGWRFELDKFVQGVADVKHALISGGYKLIGDEPLKITINTSEYGYTGFEFARLLSENKIECEYFDRDNIVMMLSPQNGAEELKQLKNVLLGVGKKDPLKIEKYKILPPCEVMTPREASLMPSEELPIEQCLGRICATTSVGCPPAVPVVCAGEEINEDMLYVFDYYGIKTCRVVKSMTKH